jgi:hypothetical protein
VPKNENAIISAPPVSSSEVARQWLIKFAAICQKEVTPALANIWDEQLRDIEPTLLARACDKLMKKWDTGFLPVPGNIRKEAAGIDMWERLIEVGERLQEEARLQKEKARLEHQRRIEHAEHESQHQLPEAKTDTPTVEYRKIDFTPIVEPVRVVDIEGRRKDLEAQAEAMRAKFPITGKEARPPA